MFKINCCDGIYNSLDVHFTGACDNKCAHCIDMRFSGIGKSIPNVDAIVNTVLANAEGVDDILFLGGEPCLYLDHLINCIERIKAQTSLKIFVTTAVPKVCHDQRETFIRLLQLVDGINLSTQHYREDVADEIRKTTSKYDRQAFYASLPYKDKIRINLNIVKPFLHTKEDITACLYHYDALGFNSIKLSEIQHGKDAYVSFADVFGLKLPSPYTKGCQTYIDIKLPNKTPLLLKRSCFLCEETLPANCLDGIKIVVQAFKKQTNKYGVIYSDGTLQKGWI